jgi:hypothetical protein
VAFLAAEANAGAKASTITRCAAAIRYAHRLAGHEPPTSPETARAVMRGIRRSIGTAKDQKVPATADLIMSMLKHCPDTLGGKRDRALIAHSASPVRSDAQNWWRCRSRTLRTSLTAIG